jgi:membrane protein required for beta-lactamase induction
MAMEAASSSLAAAGGLARLRVWLPLMAMEAMSSSLAAAGGLARLRVWLAADGHVGDVFLAAAGRLALLWSSSEPGLSLIAKETAAFSLRRGTSC